MESDSGEKRGRGRPPKEKQEEQQQSAEAFGFLYTVIKKPNEPPRSVRWSCGKCNVEIQAEVVAYPGTVVCGYCGVPMSKRRGT